jgi:hypothetical protein
LKKTVEKLVIDNLSDYNLLKEKGVIFYFDKKEFQFLNEFFHEENYDKDKFYDFKYLIERIHIFKNKNN